MAAELHRILNEGGIISGVPILSDFVNLFLVQTIIIMGICRGLGIAGSLMKQPKVIFEIVGGIIIGPSAMCRNLAFKKTIFPATSLNYLSLMANIGLILYLFIVGLELDPALLMTHAKRAGGVAIMGMVVPFALGVAISSTLQSELQGDDPKFSNVSPTAFLVFIGTAMSITAFPVLARILKEGGLIYTVPGAMAMGAAALNDAVAWCLLILSISIANAGDIATAGYVFLSVVAFAFGLLLFVRPVFFRLTYLVESWHSPLWSNYLYALTIMLVFLSSWITSFLGVHYIFGPFLFGLIVVPRDSHLFNECNETIEEIVVTFMLPLYFALSGIKTDITTIRGKDAGDVVLVCFIATIGKLIGAGSVTYFSGMSFRESSVVAWLMNTRGLVELIVLNLGLDAGVLNTRTFSVMVIMCLFTTFITCPIIELIYPPKIRIAMATAAAASRSLPRLSAAAGLSTKDQAFDTVPNTDAAEAEDEESAGPAEPQLFNLEQMLKHPNVGIVVDRVEHLEGAMKVLMCFAPITRSSSLKVTGLHFHEPTFTNPDVFVGLNADNKLLDVEEEHTSVNLNTLQRVRDQMHVNKATQDMLPLSLFTKAIGGTVDAYRIRGDPINFPGELQKQQQSHVFNLIIFPWRASKFAEALFWGSIALVSSPIALLIQTHIDVLVVPEGQADSRAFHTDAHRDEAVDHKRSRSTSNEGSVPSTSAAASPDHSTSGSGLFGQNVGAGRGGVAVLPENVTVNNVLVLLTGAPCDSLLLPFILRTASNSNIQVSVLLSSDYASSSPSIEAALKSLRQRLRTLRLDNVVLEKLTFPGTDVRALMHRVATGPRYDLVVVGFSVADLSVYEDPTELPPTSPSSKVRRASRVDSTEVDPNSPTDAARSVSRKLSDASVSTSDDDNQPVATRLSRAQTLTQNFTNAIVDMVSPEPALMDHRRQIGVPTDLVTRAAALEHLELGTLGSMLYAAKLSSFVLVYHEPKTVPSRGVNRAATVIESVPFEASPAAAAAAASGTASAGGLGTIVEADSNENLEALADSGKNKL